MSSHRPSAPPQVDTLRLAIGYISFLGEMISSDEGQHAAHKLNGDAPKKVVLQSKGGGLFRSD